MIEIKIYMIMGECRIEASLHHQDPEDGTSTVTWQEPLSAGMPLRALTNAVTNALEALDGSLGAVDEVLRFGT